MILTCTINKINKYLYFSILVLIFYYFLHFIRIINGICCLFIEFDTFGFNRSITGFCYIVLIYFSNLSRCLISKHSSIRSAQTGNFNVILKAKRYLTAS